MAAFAPYGEPVDFERLDPRVNLGGRKCLILMALEADSISSGSTIRIAEHRKRRAEAQRDPENDQAQKWFSLVFHAETPWL